MKFAYRIYIGSPSQECVEQIFFLKKILDNSAGIILKFGLDYEKYSLGNLETISRAIAEL
jgi:hypothetical protein